MRLAYPDHRDSNNDQVHRRHGRIRAAFREELGLEVDRTVDEVKATYRPYLEFYEGEVERMEERAKRLNGFVEDLSEVRREIETTL